MSLISICCFKNCFEGTGFTIKTASKREQPPIILDNKHMGHDVVILKNGLRICGNGGALCTAPLVQSKSYFEVKLQQGGKWGVGLATRKADLNSGGGSDEESWVLTSHGTLRHNGTVIHSNLPVPSEGSILGVSYDHIELKFYVNGKALEKALTGIKGTLFPALYGIHRYPWNESEGEAAVEGDWVNLHWPIVSLLMITSCLIVDEDQVDEGAVLDLIVDNFLGVMPNGFERIMIEQSLL